MGKVSAGRGKGGETYLEIPAEGKQSELSAVEEDIEDEASLCKEFPAKPGEGHVGYQPERKEGKMKPFDGVRDIFMIGSIFPNRCVGII